MDVCGRNRGSSPSCIFAGANFTSLFGPDPSHHPRASAVPPTPLAHFFLSFFSGPALLSLFLPLFTSPPLPTPAPSPFILCLHSVCSVSAALGRSCSILSPYQSPAPPLLKRTGFCRCCSSVDPSKSFCTSPNQPCTSRPWKPTSPTRNPNPSPSNRFLSRQLTLPEPPKSPRTTGSCPPVQPSPPRRHDERGPRRPQLAPTTLRAVQSPAAPSVL